MAIFAGYVDGGRQCAASSSPFERMAIFESFADGGRQCAASSSPFERMTIFESFVDGGLNDSENINLRGVSEGTPLSRSSIIG